MNPLKRVLFGIFGFTVISGIGAFVSSLDDASRDDTGAIVSEGEVGIFNLEVGDCLNELSESNAGTADEPQFSGARGVSCSEGHIHEVFYQQEFPSLSLSDIEDMGTLTCFENFVSYVGVPYANSPFYVLALQPTVESFAEGDRIVDCLLHNETETTKYGSARDSGADSGIFIKNEAPLSSRFGVGECISNLEIAEEQVFGGQKVNCSDGHIYEVFYKQSLGDLSQIEIFNRAEGLCNEEFEDYVGVPYEDSNLYFIYIYPTTTSYAGGDRSVLCLLHNESESPKFGTARDSAIDENSDASEEFSNPTVFTAGDCLSELDLANLYRYNDTIVDCSTAHIYEVYYSNEFPEFSLESFESDADSICLSQFEDYVGIDYDFSSLYSTTILPSIVSYQDGDREVACLLHNEDETNTYGTARDSGV